MRLLLGTIGSRCNVKVNDQPPVVSEHDENVEHAKRNRRHAKETARGDVRNMIFDERSPSLRRWLADANHVLGDGPFGHIMPQ